MSISEVVDLSSLTSIEQIANFNERFIPEARLRDHRFLEWKYRTPTADGAKITAHYGIFDGDKLVSEISAQRMSAWIEQKWQPCDYFADWFRDPEYKGIGAPLLDHLLTQNSSLLACSASDQAYGIYQQRKFLIPAIDHRFVFCTSPINALLAAHRHPRGAARWLQTWFKRPFARLPKYKLDGDLQLSESKTLDPQLLADWETTIPGNAIFVRREPWVFSWLLEQFPFPEFKLVVLTSGAAQIGYVLLHLKSRPNGLLEGKIVDLFTLDWDKNLLTVLFRYGAQELAKSGAHIIRYHATHPLFISLAVDSGFTKTHAQIVIMNGPIAEAMAVDDAQLHITFFDHDEAYY